jgi:hypothetical protein
VRRLLALLLLAVVDDGLSRPGVLIRQLQGWVGRRKRGITSVSTTASVSGSTTVTHGASFTPSQVQATAQSGSVTIGVLCSVANVTATTFDLGIRYGDGVARTSSINVGWEAIA